MIPARANDGTSSQPGPRKHRPVKPKKGLNPHQTVRLVVTPDGRFAPADMPSRRLCKDRGMKVGHEFVAYLYAPRDPEQWAKAHQLATYLLENLEEFHGLDSHAVLKKLQLDSGHGCELQEIDLGALGKHCIKVPKTLAFGWMDDTEWTAIYRGMCNYIVTRGWLGEIDADAVVAMQKLMLLERAA
jgi:hypothetical protein